MELNELKKILDKLKIPIAYDHFNSIQKPPFIVYLETSDDNFYADNITYQDIMNVDIEVYTTTKDIVVESKVEELLSFNEISFQKTCEFIKTEKLFLTRYQISL